MRYGNCRRLINLDMLDLKIKVAIFSERSVNIHQSVLSVVVLCCFVMCGCVYVWGL
jgi:hypothetical protein